MKRQKVIKEYLLLKPMNLKIKKCGRKEKEI